MAEIQKKICMVGAYGVGKTSLVRRYVESLFDEKYLTTVGVKIDKKRVAVNGQDVVVMLWDLAGEEDQAPLRTSLVRGAAGYILVADGIRPGTLDVAEDLRRRIETEVGVVPFVLALNKADLAHQWRYDPADLQRLRDDGWAMFETSAKSGQNVEELFSTLAARLLG